MCRMSRKTSSTLTGSVATNGSFARDRFSRTRSCPGTVNDARTRSGRSDATRATSILEIRTNPRQSLDHVRRKIGVIVHANELVRRAERPDDLRVRASERNDAQGVTGLSQGVGLVERGEGTGETNPCTLADCHGIRCGFVKRSQAPDGLARHLARVCDVLHGPQGLQRREEDDRARPRRGSQRARGDRHGTSHRVRGRSCRERRARRSARCAAPHRLRDAPLRARVRVVRRVEHGRHVRRRIPRERVRPVHGLARHDARDGGMDDVRQSPARHGALGNLLSIRRHRRDRRRRVAPAFRISSGVLGSGHPHGRSRRSRAHDVVTGSRFARGSNRTANDDEPGGRARQT